MTMEMKRGLWICLAFVAIAGILALVMRDGKDSLPDGDNEAKPLLRSRKPLASKTVSSRLSGGKARAKPVLAEFNDDDDDRTPAERALEERIEKSLDDEDFEAAIACAEEALKCNVVEIRQNMIDTLGWFGKKALPKLTLFLADADEDVRENAKSEWVMAVSDIDDDVEKIGTVELAMRVLMDEDVLDEISNEYIGVDEKLAVESLVRIIDGGGSKEGVEKAKETYEFVTGDEWAGAEEAARWIAEEYEPPEVS